MTIDRKLLDEAIVVADAASPGAWAIDYSETSERIPFVNDGRGSAVIDDMRDVEIQDLELAVFARNHLADIARYAIAEGRRADAAEKALTLLQTTDIRRVERLEAALREIENMMGPAHRQQFMSRGPLAFVGIWNVVRAALAKGEGE